MHLRLGTAAVIHSLEEEFSYDLDFFSNISIFFTQTFKKTRNHVLKHDGAIFRVLLAFLCCQFPVQNFYLLTIRLMTIR
jgi:hypothetical protein